MTELERLRGLQHTYEAKAMLLEQDARTYRREAQKMKNLADELEHPTVVLETAQQHFAHFGNL